MKQSVALRENIKRLILNKDFEGLLEKAAEFHGHYCPYLALGVKASLRGLDELDIYENYGFEELLAIVEINSCFTDGIQVISGCTFGNNGLIYKDLGKTAVTLVKRSDSRGIRIRVRNRDEWSQYREKIYGKEAKALLEKITATPLGDRKRLSELLELYKLNTLKVFNIPDEKVFKVEKLKAKIPEYAPLKASIVCSVCGEETMETKATFKEQKPVCHSCSDGPYFEVNGSGVHPNS